MATVLAMSSQVVRGHVGLSAIVPVLQRLGHDVWPMPTIVLSNHPGHSQTAATQSPVGALSGMLDALDANGWLASIDAVLTGYMPSVEHVRVAAQAIERVQKRRPDAVVLVDPIMGDDPKGLYIDSNAAIAIRDQLLPLASNITPNRFELAWLTASNVHTVADAIAAARCLSVRSVIATSIHDGPERLANVAVEGDVTHICRVEKLPDAPHGTGDMLSALYLGIWLRGMPATALGQAVAGVAHVVAASRGHGELQLVQALDGAIAARPLPTSIA